MNYISPITAKDALAGVKVIDVDTHWSEPPDLWTKRAPANIRDAMPQRKIIDGQVTWVMGDNKVFIMGAASVVAKDGSLAQDMDFVKWQVEDVHDACSQPKARVELMDEQGVWAHIIYPNIMGFGGQNALRIEADKRLAASQIYNDALAEMQEESNQRLFGMALMPWWDVKLCAAEIERCAAMGLRGINLNPAPHRSGLPDLADKYWDPLWEACAKHDLPVNFHIGASDESMDWIGTAAWGGMPEPRKMTVGSMMLLLDQVKIMTNMILSGILDRFPTLKVVSVESGIGWVPFMLEKLQYAYEGVHGIGNYTLPLTPKEYFQRNFAACFWFEKNNLTDLIGEIGEDNVMFETDFPHPTCLFPDGMEYIVQTLGDNRPLLKKVTSTNAARIYNIPL